MIKDERLGRYRELHTPVLHFLYYGDPVVSHTEDERELILCMFGEIAYEVCLSDVFVFFDKEGRLDFHLPEEDKEPFRELFRRRWDAVDGVFLERDDISSEIPEPRRPDFMRKPENWLFRIWEEAGEEKFLPRLSPDQRDEYKKYSAQKEFRDFIDSVMDGSLAQKRKIWMKENKKYPFLSPQDEESPNMDIT